MAFSGGILYHEHMEAIFSGEAALSVGAASLLGRSGFVDQSETWISGPRPRTLDTRLHGLLVPAALCRRCCLGH